MDPDCSQASLSFTISWVCSNSCPSSWWCYPTISSSVTPFSSCPQSFPASGSFPMSRLFATGGQVIGTSAWASVLPMNTHGWFPLGLTGLISLLSIEPSRVQHSSKVSVLWHSSFFTVQLSHLYMTAGKSHSFDYMDLCWQSFKNLTIFKIFTII